jgi:hypothetical protein
VDVLFYVCWAGCRDRLRLGGQEGPPHQDFLLGENVAAGTYKKPKKQKPASRPS